MSDKKYTLRKLESYLKSKDFNINRVFYYQNKVLFMTIRNENLFEEILLNFDEKFSISVDNIDIKTTSIEIKPFKSSFNVEDDKEINIIDEMDSNDLIDDDQRIKEGLSLENYRGIDIENTESVLDSTYKQYMSQLEKFRECVKNIKYKFGIVTYNYLSYIQRNNTIVHYLIKDKQNYIPVEKINFLVSIDIENLFECIDTFVEDVFKMYKNFYKILSDAHKKQITALECQINTLTDIPVLLRGKNDKLNDMERCIDQTSDMITQIYQDEIRMKKIFSENEELSCKTQKEEKIKDYNTDKLYKELEKIKNKKLRLQGVLENLKNMYNHDLITFDYNIFKSVHLFESFAEKVKKIL